MSRWISKKIKDFEGAEIILGQSPSSKSYNSNKSGLPFLQGKAEFGMIYPTPEIYTDSPLKIAEANDLLMSVRAPVGDVNLSPYKLSIGRGLAALRFTKNNSRFYFYWFSKNQKFIESLGAGSTFKAITGEQLRNIEIPIVDTKEQTAIANILSTVDEAIQKADEAIKKTERIKQGMLQKLLTEGIGHTEFKETKIGRIPKEWVVKAIGDLGKVYTGKTPSSFDKSLWDGDIPFVTPGDISDMKYVVAPERYVSESGSQVAAKLPRNSLMVVCIGSTIGKVALTGTEVITNQQINSLIVNEKEFFPDFIYYSFIKKSKIFKAFAGTAAVPIINKTLFEKFQIPISTNKEEQKKISIILSEFDDKLLLLKNRKDRYIRIKQGFMHDLLTGRKRVK
jgi:type I restriction enzyme, S subunit